MSLKKDWEDSFYVAVKSILNDYPKFDVPVQLIKLINEHPHAFNQQDNRKWINVEDELPKDKQEILCWWKGLNYTIRSKFCLEVFNESINHFTHWMPDISIPKLINKKR